MNSITMDQEGPVYTQNPTNESDGEHEPEEQTSEDTTRSHDEDIRQPNPREREIFNVLQALIENQQHASAGSNMRRILYSRPDGSIGVLSGTDLGSSESEDDDVIDLENTVLFGSGEQELEEDHTGEPLDSEDERSTATNSVQGIKNNMKEIASRVLVMMTNMLVRQCSLTTVALLLVIVGMAFYGYNYPLQKAEMLSTIRFREVNFTGMFPLHSVDVVRDYDFDDCPHRLSVVVQPNLTKQVWVMLPCSDSIFTVDTDSPSTSRITFPDKFQPKAVQQINAGEVAVASESGLYLADTTGSIRYRIMTGKYSDVTFDGEKIYALEYQNQVIEAASMNVRLAKWEKDIEFHLVLNSDCDQLYISCHDRFRTFLVYKKFFYVTSSTGFKILKYNRVGQLTESYNHDHLLAEHNTSLYSGFSVSAIDTKKVLALCNVFGTDIFLRKSDNKLHGNRPSKGIKHIWDIVIFKDDVYVLWGKNRYTVSHISHQSTLEDKMGKFNPQGAGNKYQRVRNINGNFHLLLGDLETRSHKDIVQLNGVSHRLGVVQFDTITELWVPITKKHFIQVYTLLGIKSYEIYFPDFDFIYPIAVLQVEQNEVILASEEGLFCLNRYGVIQYKLTDGKFSDITFDQNRLVSMDYKNNRVVKFSRQQGKWVEKTSVSFQIKSLHLHSDSYNTLVVQGKHTFVASSSKYQVQKYSMTGILLNTYQSEQKKVTQRMRQSLTVSGIDSRASILLCDFYNNQLLTLSANGRYSEYQLAGLRDVRDAVIIKKTLYVLSGIANHKITAVTLE